MENDNTMQKQRPVFLTVLCVIAFIHVGVSILMGLIGIITSPELGWFHTSGLFGLFSEGMSHLLGLFWSVIILILSIIAFLGIIQIWNMMRMGVLVFSIPLFLTIIIPLILMGGGWWILIPNIIILFFLIFLFALNYERLKK